MKKYFSITLQAWDLLKPFHKKFYLQLVLIFSLSGIAIFSTLLQGKIFTEISNKDLPGLLFVILGLFSVGLVETLVTFLKNRNEEKNLNHDIGQHLQKESLTKILSLTTEQHIEDHSAIKQQVVVRGENAIETIIKSYITGFFPNISYVLISIGTLFYYSTLLGTISLVFSIILVLWMTRFLNFFKPLVKENRDNWTEQSKIRTEAFTHLSLVKSLGREDYFVDKYLSKRKKFADFGKYVNLISVNHRGKKGLYADISQNITLLAAGILAVSGFFSLATAYVVWSITNRAFWSISALSDSLRDLPTRYAEAEQYLDAINMTPSFDERGLKNIKLDQDITFKNISFKYTKSTLPIFTNLSFTIPSNKITAFVGHSGSGKSTLAKILLRAYDYKKGSIKIGEYELNTIDAVYLREHVGYVEQHVDLLDDTIKENILISVTEKNRKKAEKNLEEISKQARITEFYDRLGEKRWNTIVGERGIKLSGGERQRVGIARAIIKNPEILIFDEATSSLDSENESKVMEAIQDVSVGKTTIIIAHRLSTVRKADKIILMSKGKIAAEGTHDELLENSSHYKTLVEHQVLS